MSEAVALAPVPAGVPAPADPPQSPRDLVDSMLHAHLRDQLNSRFDPTEVRLSEAGGCMRARVAKAAGQVPAGALASDEWDAGYFARGRLAERLFAMLVRAAFPRHWRREVTVTHPWGTGHIDFWYPEGRFFVELKSATIYADGTLPDLPRRSHLLQTQAYLHFFKDAAGQRRADQAVLLYLCFGQRLDWRLFPVRYVPEIGERIEADLVAIDRHVHDGTLPAVPAGYSPFAFPCAWKSRSGNAGRCPLFDRCWGPEAEPREDGTLPAQVVGGEVERLGGEYGDLHAQKGAAEKQAELFDDLMKEMRPQLEAAFTGLQAKKVAGSDGVTVTRSEVAGRKSVDWDAAVTAGAVDAGAVVPFTTAGAPSVRYLVRQPKTGSKAG